MPRTEPICRDIVMTALPVAKRSGGSEAAPALVSVGSVSPTPRPVASIPGRTSAT